MRIIFLGLILLFPSISSASYLTDKEEFKAYAKCLLGRGANIPNVSEVDKSFCLKEIGVPEPDMEERSKAVASLNSCWGMNISRLDDGVSSVNDVAAVIVDRCINELNKVIDLTWAPNSSKNDMRVRWPQLSIKEVSSDILEWRATARNGAKQ